ncbi:MAG: hypothetical protein ACFFAQ_11665 [Promethearchaeota archaeon]
MQTNNLIFTFSGIRGIVGKNLNFEIVKKIAISFGLWFNNKDKRVIIGKDTRPSGDIIEKAFIEGLIATDFNITNVGVCPTPIIIHARNSLDIPAGIIITGSHNPQEWNGIKLLSKRTYLGPSDLYQISTNLNDINLDSYHINNSYLSQKIVNLNPIPEYVNKLFKYINLKQLREQNNLNVVIDTGAGAGKCVTPQVLERMGCKVKVINNDLLDNSKFPREIEPIEKNLNDLIMEVRQGDYDIGFAHDSDADRLAIIGDNGVCYPEDVGLALITENYLKKYNANYDKIIFITNLASSLMFEVLAKRYNAQIIRTPIGERFLSEEMYSLLQKCKLSKEKCLIFGGEGSCGGVMFPPFNNTRDGIFAAAKIVDLIISNKEKISSLVSLLPKYYAHRESIDVLEHNVDFIINQTKKELIDEGEIVSQVGWDLRFGKNNEWFVLIHPSNTEPIIRIICEAKRKSLARIYCQTTAELVKLVISKS